MKKFFTMIAFAATACMAVCMNSCHSESTELIPVNPEETEYVYMASISAMAQDLQKVKETVATYFNNEVLKGIGTFSLQSMNVNTISTKDKEKCDAALKQFANNHQALDDLLSQIEHLSNVSMSITYNGEVVVSYSFMPNLVAIQGTYVYNEVEDGGATHVWKLTLTNQTSDLGNYLKGSLVVPHDMEGAQAGTYEGIYSVTNSTGFTFLSDAKMESGFSLIHVNMVERDGKPVYTIQINRKNVLEGAVFEKQ